MTRHGHSTSTPGTVYLVGAGPGDPGLLTRHGADALARADVVVYDRLADDSMLSLAPADAELVYVGKQAAVHAVPQPRSKGATRSCSDAAARRRPTSVSAGSPVSSSRA